jgi:hypothetical protein
MVELTDEQYEALLIAKDELDIIHEIFDDIIYDEEREEGEEFSRKHLDVNDLLGRWDLVTELFREKRPELFEEG